MPDLASVAVLALGTSLGVGIVGEVAFRHAERRVELRTRFARLVVARTAVGRLPKVARIRAAGRWRWAPLALAGVLASGGLGWVWLGVSGLLVPSLLLLISAAAVRARDAKRRVALAEQLSTFLGHVARACQAGRTLPKAIELSLRDAEDPLRGVFTSLCAEVARGAPLDEAMLAVGDLYPVRELHVAALPMLLHERSDSDLAGLLRLAIAALGDCERLGRERGALRAQTRQVAGALIVLPLLFALGAPLALPAGAVAADALGPSHLVWGCVLVGLAVLWRTTRIA